MKSKSSNFKKKYASSMSNSSQKGVWSGRGIGIPVAGAVDGSADGSKYLGRPRRPYYDGEQGSPSQSADSTFSSYLARVNKGRDDEVYTVMFPDQDPPEPDSYSMDSGEIRSRKLPRRSRMVRGRAVFSESETVENSRYSLKSLEEDVGSPLASAIGNFAKEVGGDAVASGLAAIPVLGNVIAPLNVYRNFSQLKSGMENSNQAIEDYYRSFLESTPEDVKRAQDESIQEVAESYNDLITDLIDLAQRLVEMFPDAETPAGEAASFASSLFLGFRRAASTIRGARISRLSGFSQQGLFAKAKMAALTTPVLKIISGIFDADQGEFLPEVEKSAVLAVPERLVLLSDIMESYDNETAPPVIGNLPSPTMTQPYLADASGEYDQYSSYPSFSQNYTGMLPMDETKKLEIQDLKEFIRESLKTDLLPVYQDALPHGYDYRRPEVIVHKDAERDGFETLDNYDDYSVAYKTDGGVISYQSRNKLKESAEVSALRRIIRSDIKSILEDSQKKK